MFKVGDRVESKEFGLGTVRGIEEHLEYPIRVDFDNKAYRDEGYTEDGQWHHANECPERNIKLYQPTATNATQALIRFMELKQAAIGPDISYFTYVDAQAIAAWSPEEAQQIWQKIDYALKERPASGRFASFVCPFCVKYRVDSFCGECEYAEQHGICTDPDSDYKQLSRSKRTAPMAELWQKANQQTRPAELAHQRHNRRATAQVFSMAPLFFSSK